jgi:hypothetical protein
MRVRLAFLLATALVAGCEGCLPFSPRFDAQVGGISNSPATLISDSPEVRRLLGEEDAREETVSQFWREHPTEEEGRRRVEDMIQHPDEYPPRRNEFLKTMTGMPGMAVPGRSYCDIIERSKSTCGRLPTETATYVLVQVTTGPSKGQSGWVCQQQLRLLLP